MAIPIINAIKTLFVFFATTPVIRALMAPGIPSEIILGTINESKSVPGNAFIKFSTNLCLDSIFPIKSPPNLKE